MPQVRTRQILLPQMHAVSTKLQRQRPVIVDKQLSLVALAQFDRTMNLRGQALGIQGFQPQLQGAGSGGQQSFQLVQITDHGVNTRCASEAREGFWWYRAVPVTADRSEFQ